MALLGIAAGLSIVSSVLGYGESRKANKASANAEALAAKRSAIANVQNRRAALASIRRQQAQQVAGAVANGMAGGSGDRGTSSSIASQGLAGIANADQQIELGASVNEQIGRANASRTRAGDYAAIGSLAMPIAQLATSLTAQPAPTVPELPQALP